MPTRPEIRSRSRLCCAAKRLIYVPFRPAALPTMAAQTSRARFVIFEGALTVPLLPYLNL